ncbi:hypothetical protein GCM10023232_08670 [Sphingosinicella ginsenosidimutans]
MTCSRCFEAFRTGFYPAFVAKHPGSYFRRRELEADLRLTPRQLDRLIERGELVARHDIFLRKENPQLTVTKLSGHTQTLGC